MIQAGTNDLPALQRDLIDRFARFRRSVRTHLIVEGMALWLGEAVALAALSFLLDRWLRLSLGTRIGYVTVCAIALAVELRRRVLTPLAAPMGPVDLAAALDRTAANGNGHGATASAHRLLAPRVATVLQLPLSSHGGAATSAALVRLAVLRSYQSLEEIALSSRLNRRRLAACAAAIAVLALLPAGLALARPATAALWARRWFMGSNQPWPQRTYLEVAGLKDGKLLVPLGESYVVRVRARAGSIDPESVTLRLRRGHHVLATAALTRFGAGDFRYDASPLQSSAQVELWGGDDAIGPFTIQPVERPRIVRLQLSARHPTQPKAETFAFSGDDSDLAFLPKTNLDLMLTANVPVESVRMSSSATHPAQSDLRRLSDREFAVRWTHEQAVQMQMELVAAQGGLTSLPAPITVGLKSDLPPRATIQYTGVRQRITPQAKVPVTIEARDDYGVARVQLTVAHEPPADTGASPATRPSVSAAPLTLMGPAANPTELELRLRHTIDVAAMHPAVGSLVLATAEATDGCYTGPQTGRSRTVTFRVVAPEELFREILLRQQGERTRFRKTIEEAQHIREQLDTVVTQDDATRLARRHAMLQSEVSRVWNSLSESLTEMRLNALGSPEAYGLMEKNVLAPLKALHDDAMTRQKEALESLGRLDRPHALTDAAARQDQIVAAMQQILKQMSQWDSFVDVLNQLNEIIKLQGKVRDDTVHMRSRETEGIFDK